MKKNPFDYPIFADCGAPSLYNKLSRRTNVSGTMGAKFSERKFDNFAYTETQEYKDYLRSYIDFLVLHKDKIDHYSNLDVINNPSLTYRNQKLLEEAGLSPIPVFHLGSDVKWLKRYLKTNEYIALGGLVPNPTKVLIPMLDTLFKDHLLDSNGFPTHKLHGFACTSMPLMLRYPWYSVDSTTCRKLAIFGSIIVPEFTSEKLVTLSISSRDIPLEKKVTPGVLQAIKDRAEAYNITLDDLSQRDIIRAVWNYLIFAEKLQKLLPAWPWNFKNKKAGEGADEFLTFYFAGVLSAKEEPHFWKGVAFKDVEKIKGRLQSFFYKTQLEQAINLKFNGHGSE